MAVLCQATVWQKWLGEYWVNDNGKMMSHLTITDFQWENCSADDVKLIQWNWSSIRSKVWFVFVIESSTWFFVDFEFYMISHYLWPNTRWKLPSASKQRRRLQVDHDCAVWCLSESCVAKKTDLHSSLLKSKHDERFIFLVFGNDWRWKNWWNEFYITGMFFLWSNATYPSHCV